MSRAPLRYAAVALVSALLALAFAAAPAPAPTTPKSCGSFSAGGKRFVARAHVVSCRFARTWSARYLRSRRRPAGWRCRRYNPRETRIAFVCRRGGRDYYAIRR